MSEYVYIVDLESVINDQPQKKEISHCKISSRNIVAFSNDSHVYILPLEKPNEVIPVLSSSSHSLCNFLSWTDDGNYLMVVYNNGIVNVYRSHVNFNSFDAL